MTARFQRHVKFVGDLQAWAAKIAAMPAGVERDAAHQKFERKCAAFDRLPEDHRKAVIACAFPFSKYG